jgi:CRP-like cAMP-binding protein
MTSQSPLASVTLFADLDAAALEGLEAFAFSCSFEDGEIIVEEGRVGNGLYIIVSGQTQVFRNTSDGRVEILRTMGPGEPFGELALLGEWPRTASVRAIEPTQCLGIDRWLFLSYLERHPQVAIRLLQVLAHRLADSPEPLEE